MDRVFSTRLDDRAIDMLDALATQTGASKKSLLERAIRILSAETAASPLDLLAQTSGAWGDRKETPAATVRKSRAAFNASMRRHQRP